MTFYTGDPTYDTVLAVALAAVVVIAITSPLVPSPYGRFASPRFGIAVDPRLGWFLMELPSTLSFAYFYLRGPHRFDPAPLVMATIFAIHYANRGFYFPLSMRVPRNEKSRTTFSVFLIAFGAVVTTVHGYLNGARFSTFGHYPPSWLTDPRFLAGVTLYAISLALNIHSDAILRNLRTPDEVDRGERVYRIPQGGLFRYVSSPSYLTELCAWTGFAIFTWSLGGVFILAISTANLVPRALATHRWYQEKFPDYPQSRKALIPFAL